MTEVIQEKIPVSSKLAENIQWLNQEMAIEKSFDIIARDVTFAGKKATLIFVDGFAKDQIIMYILRSLALVKREQLGLKALDKLVKQYINYTEVEVTDDLHQVVDNVLAGPIAILVDGETRAILIDAREYPARQPEEPDLERVVRGPRDGLVETLVHNTALIRRRLRDPRLCMEMMKVGARSKTDVCLAYLSDVADPGLVEFLKDRIGAIQVDGMPMAEKSLVEFISPGTWWHPFPRVRYTERPDVIAAHILEGHIAVLVDTSPSVLILPTTFFHHLQHAEEYRQAPLVGVFLRWIRFLGVLASVLLVPLYLLVSLEPRLLPPELGFLGPSNPGKIGLMYQFLLAEAGITGRP